MASQADTTKGSDGSSELTDPFEMQRQRDLEALSAKVAVMEEKMALCDTVLQDLMTIQRIVQEKGLRDAALQQQNK